MAAGSSVQGRPARVQAWKLVTFEALAASVSSTHASWSSTSCSGERGSLSADGICAAEMGRLRSALAGFLWKKLRNPICGSPFFGAPPGVITPRFRFDRQDTSTVAITRFLRCPSAGIGLALSGEPLSTGKKAEGPHSMECGPSRCKHPVAYTFEHATLTAPWSCSCSLPPMSGTIPADQDPPGLRLRCLRV